MYFPALDSDGQQKVDEFCNQLHKLYIQDVKDRYLIDHPRLKEHFERTCTDLNIKLDQYFFEDISKIFLYSCQIVLNGNIYLTICSGIDKDMAYLNAIAKFFEYCLGQKNNHQDLMGETNYFTNDLKESIQVIDRTDDFIKECRNCMEKEKHISKFSEKNYQTLKSKLTAAFKLFETYEQITKDSYLCSIHLECDGVDILLQQGEGIDKDAALKNAVANFLDSYSIVPNDTPEEVKISNGCMKEDEILSKLKENVDLGDKDNKNYWDEIHKAINSLGYHMTVDYENSYCIVKINGIQIVREKDKCEYIAKIKACKSLVKKIKECRTSNRKPIAKESKVLTGFQSSNTTVRQRATSSTTSIPERKKDSVEEREKKLKDVVAKIQAAHAKEPSKAIWPIFLAVTTQNDLKFDPKYDALGNGKFDCSLLYQQESVAKASGDSRQDSRENAAKAFLKSYL